MRNRKKRFEEEVYSANIAKSSPGSGHKAKVKKKEKIREENDLEDY